MWGYLMDKFGFQILMTAITLIEIIISTSLYFAVNYSILYVISVLIISACLGGHFAILSPQFNKSFGFDVGPELYGITGNFIGLASLCGPLMTNFILKTKKDFLVVFIIGGGFCMIKLLITLIFDENDKFVYKERINDLLNEHKSNDKKISEADIKQIIDDDE
jgi:MFS family permease